MAPENGLPVVPYDAEHNGYDGAKDEYLLSLIEELEDLRKAPDVRTVLEERYKIRQTLKNAKLI
jgi:hypothetical protein